MRQWRPDVVLLPYQQSPEMDYRIPACQHVFSRLVPKMRPEHFVPVPVKVANPADYGKVWRPLHEALQGHLLPHRDTDVRILLGPGTPAFNLGLFLFRYRVMPSAKLFQVFNPDDVEVTKTKFEADWKLPVLVALDKPGETLPDLIFAGQEAPEVVNYRSRLAELEAELARVRAALAVAENGVGGSVLTPEQELQLHRDPGRKFALARLVEVNNARNEGRAPSQKRAGELLGITRQGFAKGLKDHGLSWP